MGTEQAIIYTILA